MIVVHWKVIVNRGVLSIMIGVSGKTAAGSDGIKLVRDPLPAVA
jgi:hypothetical protein